MLEYIEVDGFKSLRNFSLQLKPGLNILIGPNGSGKTNIISFVEFLGLLQINSVSKAISAAGGAGSVFYKLGEDKYLKEIVVKLKGNVKINARRWIYYEYDFTISLSNTFDIILYSTQRIKCKNRTVHTDVNKGIKDFNIDIERNTDSEFNSSIIFHRLKISKNKGARFYIKSKNLDNRDLENKIKTIIEETIDHTETLIPSLRYLLEYWYLINNDFKSGIVYNIEPSRCRVPEDAAKPPGIHKDGSGLYATLFALSQLEQYPRIKRSHYYLIRNEIKSLKSIGIAKLIDYIKLANSSIVNITVSNNPFDNQLQVKIYIENTGKENSILPLTAMSDGTVKWICLVTILLTSNNVLSIEEPENYLHPLMLKEIVSIMRNVIGDRSIILLSTHSETLLNNSLPEEIVIVQFKNGATQACRPTEIENIKDEINATGFGLGYYYLSGALDE